MAHRVTTPTILIRPLQEGDLPALEWDGQYTQFRPVFRATFADVQRGQKLMLLAEVDATVVGQVFVQLLSSETYLADGATRGYLYSLRVRPQWQGLGIGTQLLAHAEDELRARGRQVATIAAAKDNPGARRLYERLGYRAFREDAGEWWFTDVNGVPQHLAEPCWMMEKLL